MPKKESGKKGGKKIGRSMRSPSHVRYANQNRWLVNKIRDLRRHIKAHTNLKDGKMVCNDRVALRSLKEGV